MRTMTAEFVAMGRFTRYSGKEAVIKSLKNGEMVSLKFDRDEGGQIVLVNPATGETAGCIPPNPSYGENYDLLESFIDMKIPMKVVAFETCGKDKHYRVQVTVTIED